MKYVKDFFGHLMKIELIALNHSDDTYSFIGNPPTNKRFDYTQAWKEVESFFKKMAIHL